METLTGPLISHPDICRILSNRCRARDNDCSVLFDIRRILHDLLVTLIRRVDLREILRRRRHPTVHAHSPRLRLKHHQVGTVFPVLQQRGIARRQGGGDPHAALQTPAAHRGERPRELAPQRTMTLWEVEQILSALGGKPRSFRRIHHHFPFHAVIAGLVIGRRARLSGLFPGPGGRGRRRRSCCCSRARG